MSVLPDVISRFITQNHVVSLACHQGSHIWATSCFYAFDAEHTRLIILTNQATEHGQLMAGNPAIAGTIAGQPLSLHEIEGVQFSAAVRRLEGDEQAVALQHYFAKHPIARQMKSDVWEVKFQRIKHTCNRERFAQKTEWRLDK